MKSALGIIRFVRINAICMVVAYSHALPSLATPKLPTVIETTKDRAVMQLVPEGTFTYGIKKHIRNQTLQKLKTPELDVFESQFDEKEAHLPDYYIDKYEVTNRQYSDFLEDTGHGIPKFWNSKIYNEPNQPVVGVSWDDAFTYAKWAGKRLPTEEEWEKAARGTDGNLWPWGNKPSGQKYNGRAQQNFRPVDVGSYENGASPYGVMDMAGNVYEMTTGKWINGNYAMRGGSFLNSGAHSMTTFRWALKGQESTEYLGFRCVLDSDVIKVRAIAFKSIHTVSVQGNWGVIFGGDKSLKEAKHEVTTAAKQKGLRDAAIYHRKGSYRSVVTATDRTTANRLLADAKKHRVDAYIVKMSSWCPMVTEKMDHFVCSDY